MELGHQSAKSAFAGSVSDDDLIRRYCADPPDKDAGEQLFGRCIPRLRTAVRKMVFAKSSICPDWYSKDAFIDDALSIANEKLFRGIRTFNFECAFNGWLGKVAKNAVLDTRRQLVGRGKEPRPRPQPIDNATERELAHSASFQSKYWFSPETFVRDREIREVVRKLLTLHLWDSLDRRESPDAIELYWFEDRPLSEIANRLGCSERNVWRLFSHDYEEIQKLLADRFGISDFGQL